MPGDTRQADALAIEEQMSIANLQRPHAERRAACVKDGVLRVSQLDLHAIEVRLIDSPELRSRQSERNLDIRRAARQRGYPRIACLHAIVRTERRDTHCHRRPTYKCVAEKDAIVNHRARRVLLRADILPHNPSGATRSQPHIPHHAAVRPPVIPGISRAARRDSGNGRNPGAIVDPYRQYVGVAEARSDVEGIGGEAAFVATKLDSVQPHTGAVESRSEMQLDVRAGRQRLLVKAPEIPSHSEVVVQPADIPGVWDRDRFRIGRNR